MPGLPQSSSHLSHSSHRPAAGALPAESAPAPARPRAPAALAIGALVVGLALRLPSSLVVGAAVDEAAFATIGRGLLHGHMMYRDLVDHKPPGIELLLAAL